MTKGEILLRRELKREMGSTEPLLEEEIERLNNIIKEAINYIKDNKGHIKIYDLYIILQKGSDK